MKTHILNDRCPWCRRPARRTVGQDMDPPSEGDFSICADCRIVSRFGDGLKLRPLTDAEVAEVMADAETVAALRAAGAALEATVRASKRTETN